MNRVKSAIGKIFSRTTTRIALVPAIAASSLASHAADKHPFGIDDYSALHSAGPVGISPDGKTILYDVTTDGLKGPTKHEYRLVDVNGSNPRKLDLPEKFRPTGFTKDGSLWGTHELENAQLAIVPLAAAKPVLVISLPNGIQSAAISPDGMRFALLAEENGRTYPRLTR